MGKIMHYKLVEKAFKKLTKLYNNPYINMEDIYDSRIGYWWEEWGPRPRSYTHDNENAVLYLNYNDGNLRPILCLDVKSSSDSVEVHVSEWEHNNAVESVDEYIIEMLCKKYGFIKTDKFRNHFYTQIDSDEETEIKEKVGQMLNATAFVYLVDWVISSIVDAIENEDDFYMFRGSARENYNIEMVKDRLKRHDWTFNIKDTENGFDIETVFADSKGKPLKLSAYQEGKCVYLSCGHKYKELSKLENVDKILGCYSCELSGYLGRDNYECIIDNYGTLIDNEYGLKSSADDYIDYYFQRICTVMLIAENLPVFKRFLKNEVKEREERRKKVF